MLRQIGVWLLASVATLGGAHAQGIDCTRARSATEKAICASPELLALDHQVALAYADALARAPDQRLAMRQDLLRWLRARDAACTVPGAELPACLDRQLTVRLAALAPPQAAPAPQAAAQSAAPTSRPSPIPSGGPAQAAATIVPAALPAAPAGTATLTVTSPGRFTLAAHSRSGAALQLVDMLTGPSPIQGEAGARDGRIDALLDKGTYRLRVFMAPGAGAGAPGPGDGVTLSVTAFTDAAPPQAAPVPGAMADADLADGRQRAFWLLVPPDGVVRVEAAGRSLADLRLWQNGRDLAALEPVAATVEPVPGHPLTVLRLDGRVEPGTYLAVAYGGPALAWTGGDAQPFHLRAGLSDALAEGLATGRVGPFGSEAFAAPPAAGVFRLVLPQPAPAALAVGQDVAALERTSREPEAMLRATPGRAGTVVVSGAEGQPFTLRAQEAPGAASLSRPGTYWVSAIASGAGGDEVPPTVLLQRSLPPPPSGVPEPPRIVASNVPRIGPGMPWHARFNLRGPTELITENRAGGPVTLHTVGTALHGDDAADRVFDMPPGFQGLRLVPQDGAGGVIEVTAGPPGPAPLVQPLPRDPVIPLGVQALGPGMRLDLLAQTAPGVQTGLSARPVPVALAAGPLFVTQAALGAALTVPVLVAPGGTLRVRDLSGAALDVPVAPGPHPGTLAVTLPPAPQPRTVVLSWQRPPPPADIPAPAPPGSLVALSAGFPVPFDLRENETRSFALAVPEGGLFRVETLGRLRMRGRLSSAFVPGLGQDEAGGTGQNMLVQRWLRAGEYRVSVAPEGSAGHGAILAAPAPLIPGAGLIPGGRVHLALPAGTGGSFPVTVTQPGRYRLELRSQGPRPTARLDDADGWPVTAAGPMDGTELALQPGAYRLLVSPQAVATVVAARLSAIVPAAPILGHGPHPLPAEAPQDAVWREPAGSDPRVPDAWMFTLRGPAKATLALSDGMTGTLRGPDGAPVRIERRWTGPLAAGEYRLEATSLGRNDRLAYTVALSMPELQPDTPRSVTLPATVPFSLAASGVVGLSSWGGPVKAVLRAANGTELLRSAGRPEDWNLGFSRRLPAGRFQLELSTAVPSDDPTPVPQDPGLVHAATSDDAAADAPATDGDDPAASNGAGSNGGDTDAAGSDDTGSDGAGSAAAAPVADVTQAPQSTLDDNPPGAPTRADASGDDAPAAVVELRLDLPPGLAPVEAPATAAGLQGTGVHVLRLPQPGAGALVVAQAASAGTTVLSLERQEGADWRTVSLAAGTAPLVAALGDDAPASWRLEAWAADGGTAPIRLAARLLADGGTALVAQDGFPGPLAAARLRLDTPALLALGGAPAGMLAASWPGHAAMPVTAGRVAPQGNLLWLLAPAPGPVAATALLPAPRTPVSLAVPAAGVVHLAAASAAGGHVRFWRVESGMGQPGLGGALAEGGALAPAAGDVTLRNAGGTGALPVEAVLLDLPLLPPAAPDMAGGLELPAGSAVPVQVAGGPMRLVLPPGVAAFAADGSAAWADRTALVRDLDLPAGVLTVVNTLDRPQAATLAGLGGERAAVLRPGGSLRRFFGAAGSFELPVEGAAGATLSVAGDATLQWTGADGTVQRGRDIRPAADAGRLVVSHAPGAVVLGMAAPGASPWPSPPPQPMPAGGRAVLAGPAMAWPLAPTAPVLLDVSTTSPVLLAIGDAPPELFAAGAELHRALPAGATVLRALSPDDGPLSGTLGLAMTALHALSDGLGPVTAVAPGGTAAFSVTLARPAKVGIGVRAEPDRVDVRLLRGDGTVLGSGVAQLLALPAGTFLLEARVPADGAPTTLRPAVLGLSGPGNGPPPDVVRHYLELAGLKEPTP